MLVYAEMFLRESLNVNSQTLTYCGLEDFSEEVDSSELKANHVLVSMFQSLGSLGKCYSTYCSFCILWSS